MGNTVFVVPLDCSICGKAQYHIQANCLEAPQNAALKAKAKVKRAAEKAVKAAQGDITKWRCSPAGSSNTVNNTINTCDEELPDCANPPNPNKNTSYLDCAASTSILGMDAICDVAPVQEPNISLNRPSHVPIYTSQSLPLRLLKLPHAAKPTFLVKDIPHNLVPVSELVNAGCSVHMYFWGFNIDYEGEIIYKG